MTNLLVDRTRIRNSSAVDDLRRLLKELTAEVGCEEATLWVRAANGTHLDVALNHGSSYEGFEELTQAIDGSVVGMVASMGIAQCNGPGDYHDPTIDKRVGATTRSMVVVPVSVGQQNIGVLSAWNSVGRPQFTHEDQDVVEWRARIAGAIIRDRLGTEPATVHVDSE